MKLIDSGMGRGGLRLAVIVAGLFGAQAAFAQYVAVGGTISLGNGPGAGPGGEFVASVLSGGSGSFNTFCLEKNEFFSYGQTLRVNSITTNAMNGGVGGGNPDPISTQTAWLYTQFRAGSLSNYDYLGSASARASDANALQNTIWYLENEITSIGEGITATETAQANTWLTQANNAATYGFSNTRVAVLNLRRESSIGSGNFNANAQDQLYITPVPEPETYMMLLAGLGLMGFVARRRQRGNAA